MAKNYTIKEACEVLAANKDFESIMDIHRRYPMLAHVLTGLISKAGSEFVNFMNYMPEYMTANKLHAHMKKVVDGGADTTKETDESADEVETPVEEAPTPAKKTRGKAKVEEPAEEEDTDEAGPYDGKSAMDLFKECKKRGLKVETKKPAKFYADILMKDDAKKDEPADDAEDWGDEEEEKPAKKTRKAPAKKAAKEDSEDDDWDI